MYLKYNGEAPCHRNEFNALRTVRRFTSVPVPTPLDIVARPPTGTSDPSSSASSSPDPISYLLMSKLPGAPICNCHDFLSDADCRAIAIQLKDYLTQIRSIPPKQANPDLPISNTLGGAIRDPRIKSWAPLGPFPDEAAFSRELMFPDDPARRGHRTVFTHGDLNARNILVDRVPLSDGTKGWRVSGIVDWETAGYYPEYWDYTKAMFEGFRWSTRHNDLIKEVFGAFGDYSRELDVERRSWEAGDAICR
jgi:aminoglycoside phosphotransferase (APT) family kinase protein